MEIKARTRYLKIKQKDIDRVLNGHGSSSEDETKGTKLQGDTCKVKP